MLPVGVLLWGVLDAAGGDDDDAVLDLSLLLRADEGGLEVADVAVDLRDLRPGVEPDLWVGPDTRLELGQLRGGVLARG